MTLCIIRQRVPQVLGLFYMSKDCKKLRKYKVIKCEIPDSWCEAPPCSVHRSSEHTEFYLTSSERDGVDNVVYKKTYMEEHEGILEI